MHSARQTTSAIVDTTIYCKNNRNGFVSLPATVGILPLTSVTSNRVNKKWRTDYDFLLTNKKIKKKKKIGYDATEMRNNRIMCLQICLFMTEYQFSTDTGDTHRHIVISLNERKIRIASNSLVFIFILISFLFICAKCAVYVLTRRRSFGWFVQTTENISTKGRINKWIGRQI